MTTRVMKWRVTSAAALATSLIAFSLVGHANAAGQVTLKAGVKNPSVATLQQALDTNKVKDYFTYSGSYTTFFGSATTTALKNWENANRANRVVRVDGIIVVGSTEWNLLLSQRASAGTVRGLDPRCSRYKSVICINLSTKAMYYLENSKVLQTQAIRPGRPGYATRLGDHVVYGKDANAWSNLYHVRMPWSIKFDRGIYVHYSSQFAQVGYGYPYGSYGCVNERDWNKAKWLFKRVTVGKTRVVVYR